MGKNSTAIIQIIIVLCMLGLVLSVFDFLAYNDIQHDYVGSRIREDLDPSISENLPEHCSTKLEWGFLAVSFIFRLAFFTFCVIALSRLVKKLSSKEQA